MEYDELAKLMYPGECPPALQRWANSLIRMRVDGKRVAGWRWDGVSDEIILVLSPKGTKYQRIGGNTWAEMHFPKGTLVVQDVYGEAVFKVVDHRRGNAVLRSEIAGTFHQADIRHLTKVGVAPLPHPASKLGDAATAKGKVGIGHGPTASFLGQGEGSTPLASVSEEAALDHLRRMRSQDSEGNEDSEQGMPGGHSAARGVRPDLHSAAAGLGEDEPVAASSLSPRMPIKEESCT